MIGVSMGGHVALDVAIAHPERVERLVLVGPESYQELQRDGHD